MYNSSQNILVHQSHQVLKVLWGGYHRPLFGARKDV